MSEEVGSVKPNPYIFDIEKRRRNKPRLAHDLGAGAKCSKCGDKCPGFELHFWRKICMNCRCGKDDHDVQDDDEDIGKLVIGKLFERPHRTKEEELEFSYGNHLEMINEDTGRPEKLKFDWVPPNIEKRLAARYMALLPHDKRPVAGSEAAKERRKQLEQQVPLYDMDAKQRCENMPPEELQTFQTYIERIRTQVAGQGIVQEIAGVIKPCISEPLRTTNQNFQSGNMEQQQQQEYSVTDDDGVYAVPYSQVTDLHPYKHAQCDIVSGRKEFMGGMVEDPGRFMESSNPYDVNPDISHPLRWLGQDQNVEGITAQLAGLKTTPNRQVVSSQSVLSPHHTTSPLATNVPSPYTIPPPHTTTTKPGITTPYADHTGHSQPQPQYREGFIPSKEGGSPVKEEDIPSNQGVPYKKVVVPPNEEGIQEGFIARQGHQAFHPDTQAKEDTHISDQQNVAKKTLLTDTPRGPLSNFGEPKHRPPRTTSLQQSSLTPLRDNMMYHYQIGDSQQQQQQSHEGVVGPNKSDRILGGEEGSGKTGYLPQMQHREGGLVITKDLVQSPHVAYRETLAGSTQVAPGSDVNVLFPGESLVLGSRRGSELAEQKSKFSCQYCGLAMNVGDVAIFCERAGPDKCWHPACFSCFTCKELLADLIYFYKDGKVYCGRHFTEAVDMPRCKACDELIFGNSWTRADDSNWHIHHYCCYICDTQLAGQRYVPDKNGFPYCLPCHMAYQAKMCQACEVKIAPDEKGFSHRGYHYHVSPHCFRCYSCKSPLLGKKFKMSKNWVFCSNECVQEAAEDLHNNPNPREFPQ